jgi:hypothetical protein
MTPSLQVISESREAEADRSLWKIIVLGIFGIAASVASVAGFDRLVSAADNLYLWPTIIAFTVFLVVCILQIFLVKGLGKLTLMSFLESAAPLALFWDKVYPQTSATLVVGAVLAFVFLFVAAKRGHSFLGNSLKVRFFETSKVFLPKLVTGFLIFFSVILYLNYFEWGNFTPEMGRRIVSGLLSGSEPVVKIVMPDVSLNGTVRDLLRGLAAGELRNKSLQIPGLSPNSPETEFKNIPKQYQEKYIDDAADQLEKAFKSRFGNVNPNAKVSDFVYGLVDRYLAGLLESSPWALPAAVMLLFLFFLKGIFVLLYWFFILIAFLVFKMLIVFGSAYLGAETRSREFTLLS